MTYRAAKKLWRGLVPESASATIFGGNTVLSRAILAAKSVIERTASHDELYDPEYYRKPAATLATTAEGIVESILRRFNPRSVIDVGCGSGEILARFRDDNCEVWGLDYSEAALAICRSRGLNVAKIDLEGDLSSVRLEADLVISTEVAEHLPERCADAYVEFLCRIAKKVIIITAATPGQGGTDHVNEQPNTYWIAKFERLGAQFSDQITQSFRSEWRGGGVDAHRANNVLAFNVA